MIPSIAFSWGLLPTLWGRSRDLLCFMAYRLSISKKPVEERGEITNFFERGNFKMLPSIFIPSPAFVLIYLDREQCLVTYCYYNRPNRQRTMKNMKTDTCHAIGMLST